MKMRSTLSTVVFLFVCSFSLCFSTPAGVSIGLKAGISHCVLENQTGTGFHIGMDIGCHVHPNFAINVTPQIKTTKYYAPYWPSTDYEFTNLYVPFVFSIILGPEKSVGPYLGIGGAINVQLHGRMIDEPYVSWREIEDLEQDLYFAAVGGVEVRLGRFRILPELSFNYNLTADYPSYEGLSASNYDFGVTIGFGYAL
jgi:hypothetical protein